ncbi:MAG TPA: hypothetical protein VFK05_02230 [Polyangiaceae bacterium]|nr:hypothetical protein [Polyangiaceae bacterium]
MTRAHTPRALTASVLAPLAVLALASLLGYLIASGPRAHIAQAVAALSAAERRGLESAPKLAVANAIWAMGNEEAVKKMLRTELDRLPESEGAARARVLVRFGIMDANPDGQAAVFFQACVADPSLCDRDRLIAAAERETHARLVEPGQHLPLYLMSGHPQLP